VSSVHTLVSVGRDELQMLDADCPRPHREDDVMSWKQTASPGRWVFLEAKSAICYECAALLEHSWNYVLGSTITLSLCTACVAPHIWTT
jgi:hypothetical protein